MLKNIRKIRFYRRGERGQSFMELAISMVFLLILLSAVVDLGWAFYTMTALRDTAQEAASYGIMCPDEDRIIQRLRLSTTAPLSVEDIDEGDITVESIPIGESDAWTKGSIVKISVTINHTILVPFLGSVIGRTTYPLSVDVSDTIMVDKCPVGGS